MLTELKLKNLRELVADAGKEELIWMNGYISCLLNTAPVETVVPVQPSLPTKLTLVYGTETGNAKRTATELAAKAKQNNFQVKLASLDQYRLHDLTKEENLLVVISTQGDGEPPVAARKFYDHIHHNGFRLDKLRYSVLALGDSAYPLFCKTGEDVDAQLHKLGGQRIVPVQKCDLEYEADADKWFNTVIQSLKLGQEMPVTTNLPRQAGIQIKERKNHTATLLSSFVLNDVGAEHETWHLELTADGADYQPGDSIGIVPENAVEIVDAIIQEIKIGETECTRFKEKEVTIRELLQKKVNIHYLPERIIKKYASIVQQEIPETRIDLLDLLRIYPVNNQSQAWEVLAALPAQSPRIYTIASSPNTHGDEIHLTVEKEIFVKGQEVKTGICSAYLSGLSVGANLDFFVQRNKRFKLPAADKDTILIGPGTGIAAFRSFLSERDSLGATGKNWLFFGEKHFVSDFFYQTEIQDWFATGVLTNINLAFSEDQPKGKYVWHKMLEQGKELFEWIQAGAYIYVCGRKVPLSTEVEKALIQIIEIQGGLSAAAARDYFEKIKEAGRYAKDVY